MDTGYQQLEIHRLPDLQNYLPMWELQKKWVSEIGTRQRCESLLLLEHNHVYTLGRGSHLEHLIISKEECDRLGIDVIEIDRGGDITYHGPGQLVGYPMIQLDRWNNDAHLYLRKLEEVMITLLGKYGIEAGRKKEYTGVWVQDEKIAAIGVKFNRIKGNQGFITSHGFALNINTDLAMFENIIPCGIREYGVTSLAKILGAPVNMDQVIQLYQECFLQEFHFKIKNPQPEGLLSE